MGAHVHARAHPHADAHANACWHACKDCGASEEDESCGTERRGAVGGSGTDNELDGIEQ